MKKLYIILTLLLSLSYAKGPSWLFTDPDSNAMYFRGESTWYISNDALTLKNAKKDALKNAYSQVSNYFGLSIKSTLDIKKDLKNNTSFVQMKKSIKTKSKQILYDIKVFKSFKEFSKNKKHIKVHVLLRLNKEAENKIRIKMQKDKKEFEALKNEVLSLIEKKNFFKALTILELAKGKRAAFMDDSLILIEKRLLKLKSGLLEVSLSLNKRKFLPDEELEIEASLNKKAYLYIFYNTGEDYEMLFPNKYTRKAYVKKEELISFPNEDISDILAYEESVNKNTSIFALASKKNLSLKKYAQEEIDGLYIYSKKTKILEIINKCIDEALCSKKEIDFVISKEAYTYNISLNIQASKPIKRGLEEYLYTNGIRHIENAKKEVLINLKKRTSFSKLLGSDITRHILELKIYENNIELETIKEELDEEELFISIKEILKELL